MRDGQALLGEVSFIVVDAHVAVIHRQGAVGWVELEFGRDLRQLGEA